MVRYKITFVGYDDYSSVTEYVHGLTDVFNTCHLHLYMRVLTHGYRLQCSHYTLSMKPFAIFCSLASPIVCGNFMLANGVTVVQPHSNVTVVNSEIVFQCEGMGVTPSSNRSLCGEDGIWSPDPSQVVCRMMNTTPEGIWVMCTLYSPVP